MTTDEIRKLADWYIKYGENLDGMSPDESCVAATALRHYASSLDRKDKVERLIELGNAMADSCDGDTEHEWHEAVAEYREAQP